MKEKEGSRYPELKMNLTFEQLKEANKDRCNGYFHQIDEWSPTDWACAFAGEAGEVCNEVKKLRRLDGGYQKETRHRQEVINAIADELGDTIIYADLLAQKLGIDLGEAVRNKFNKVSEKHNAEVRL